MSNHLATAIEAKIIEFLKSKAGEPQEAARLIEEAATAVPEAEELDVRKILWRLTADGRADFTSGFKQVLLRA